MAEHDLPKLCEYLEHPDYDHPLEQIAYTAFPPMTATSPTPNPPLVALAQKAYLLQLARTMEKNAYEVARLTAIAAADAGVTEVEIARTLGVNRMTVRKWRGKR